MSASLAPVAPHEATVNHANQPCDLDPQAARRVFWSSVACFFTVTSLLPPLCFPTFRSDVLEQIIVGREWVLGSSKHPALTTWIMQVFWIGLGGSSFAPSIAASVCATATIWAVWRLGREYLTERESLAAALCLTAYWYTNMGGATMFNNNVTMIAFWCLAVLSFHFALKTNRVLAWIRTGVLVGLSLLSKYTAVELVLTMAIFMVANADARRRWRTPGPWLAIVAMTAIVLPHAVFMVAEHGESYAYLEGKRLPIGLPAFCLVLARDWVIQVLIASPILLIAGCVVGWRPRYAVREKKADYSDCFLAVMFCTPIIIQTLLQFVTRVAYPQRSYGSHLWVLMALCAMHIWQTTADARRWRIAATLTATFAVALLVSLPVSTAIAYRLAAGRNDRFYPGHDLAEKIDAIWDRDGAAACRYVAGSPGSRHACWAVGTYSRHQPHVIDAGLGRWACDDDMNTHGGMVLWMIEADEGGDRVPADIQRRFPLARFGGAFELPYAVLRHDAPRIHVGCAVVPVPPRGGGRMASHGSALSR